MRGNRPIAGASLLFETQLGNASFAGLVVGQGGAVGTTVPILSIVIALLCVVLLTSGVLKFVHPKKYHVLTLPSGTIVTVWHGGTDKGRN